MVIESDETRRRRALREIQRRDEAAARPIPLNSSTISRHLGEMGLLANLPEVGKVLPDNPILVLASASKYLDRLLAKKKGEIESLCELVSKELESAVVMPRHGRPNIAIVVKHFQSRDRTIASLTTPEATEIAKAFVAAVDQSWDEGRFFDRSPAGAKADDSIVHKTIIQLGKRDVYPSDRDFIMVPDSSGKLILDNVEDIVNHVRSRLLKQPETYLRYFPKADEVGKKV